MKSLFYTLIAIGSLIIFTPSNHIPEIKVVESTVTNQETDNSQEIISRKIDSIEHMKVEIIELQKELGLRK